MAGTVPLILIGTLLIIMEDGAGAAGTRHFTMTLGHVIPILALAERGIAELMVQVAPVVVETSMPAALAREVFPETRILAREALTRLLTVVEIRAVATADRIATAKDTAVVAETAVARPTFRPIPVATTVETTARLRAVAMNPRRAAVEVIPVLRVAVDSTAAVAEPVEDSPAVATVAEEIPVAAVAAVDIQAVAVDQC